MHRRKKALSALLICAAVCTVSCGVWLEPVPEPAPEEELSAAEEEMSAPEGETPAAEEEQPVGESDGSTPVIEERTEKDGKIQSYLTGQWTDVGQALRRPIAVMIPNNRPAMPQYGLSRAKGCE